MNATRKNHHREWFKFKKKKAINLKNVLKSSIQRIHQYLSIKYI